MTSASGPLSGVRVVEMAGLGPAPFAGMLLADMGADVVRIDRPPSARRMFDTGRDLLGRGRRSVSVDLKHENGPGLVLRLVESADALIEGFRPGVMERLGLGPDVCHARNPALVYGRMTGFGQDGPLAQAAGHDINYIALGGALGAIGRAGQPPTPPLNLVGDFGGGGMVLAFGVVCGLLTARATGTGQTIDAAMVDGTALLMTPFFAASEGWRERGTNLLDSGAPFYDVYETADGRYVAIGAIEPQFYAELLARTVLSDAGLADQMDQLGWPDTKKRFAEMFRLRTRDEWCELLEGTDACFAPVLELDEVQHHHHNAARGTLVEVDGVVQPRPTPRFDATPPAIRRPPPSPGQHTDEVLLERGLDPAAIAALRASGAVA